MVLVLFVAEQMLARLARLREGRTGTDSISQNQVTTAAHRKRPRPHPSPISDVPRLPVGCTVARFLSRCSCSDDWLLAGKHALNLMLGREQGHRINTYLTSHPLVKVCRLGHITSAKVDITFHLECRLRFPCPLFMLRQTY